jgi:peptidyl-prolyl cis-trans isomerase C
MNSATPITSSKKLSNQAISEAPRENKVDEVDVLVSSKSVRYHLAEKRQTPVQTALRRLLREPLVHFLLIGSLLFVLYGALGHSNQPGSKRIELTPDDLRQLEMAFAAQWERQPTSQELAGLVENRLREEVLYREALSMGLDKDDDIVKRRMAQKMQFLAEDVANAHEPTTTELKAWFEKNGNQFALPGRVSFHHLYFSPDQRGRRAQEDAANTLAKIAGQPADSKTAVALSDLFMFQDYYAERSPEQLAKDFGSDFARAIFKLQPGSWQGPVASGYGWHLVFIDSFAPGRIPAFEEVEPEVKSAWLTDQREQAWNKAYKAMRAKYTVSLPAPPEKQTASAPVPVLPKPENPTSPREGAQ